MDPALILLLLRGLSALLLLAFLGTLVWLLARELRAAGALLEGQDRVYGHVDVWLSADQHTRYPLRAITSIGRAPTNNIVLDNSYTSARHALITRRGRQWWLEDLKSRNGTLLNEIPLSEPTVISAADTFTIGNVLLRLDV